jgi:hypothetical protein
MGAGDDLNRLLAALFSVWRLRDADALNIYLVGSRLWGTATDASDFDLVVVATDRAFTAMGADVLHGHSGTLDVLLLSHAAFVRRIREHDVGTLICCYLPATHVWRERAGVRPTLSRPALVGATLSSSDKSWRRARKDAEGRGELGRAAKVLCHALRLRTLALQLARHGEVLDFAMESTLGPAAAACARRWDEEGTPANWAAWETGVPGEIMRRLGAELSLEAASEAEIGERNDQSGMPQPELEPSQPQRCQATSSS